jgi:multiple sugar transport system ATP-binding protein
MSEIELRHIDKYYGDNHVLKDVNLVVHNGDFLTLLGPSGCGKTTMLRILAGLEKPQKGTITIDGKVIVDAEASFFLPPSKRDLNLVFQSYALWPHMTVYDNVAFVLQVSKTPKNEIDGLVKNALEKMQIAEFSERYPSELSGGQQQRVAIARAIVNSPKLLLLDEPLSNLDAKLRIDMRGELKRLHKELGTTVVYVTHDQVEALTMSTRIAVFFKGVLAQVDTPVVLYQNPNSMEMADFIGNPKINFIDAKGRAENGVLRTMSDLGEMAFEKGWHGKDGTFDCTIGIRPEQVELAEKGVPGNVISCQPAGSESLIQVQVNKTIILVKCIGLQDYQQGERVFLLVTPDTMNVFEKASGLLVKDSVLQIKGGLR